MPYLRKTHPNQIKTYSDLMTHLWRQYHDPNQEENALQNFTKLKMGNNNNFDFFKNKFVRMSGECQRPKTQWKRELSQRFRLNCDSSISLESYCNDCSGFGQVLKIIAEENKAVSKLGKGNKGEGNRNPGSNSNSASKPTAASSGGGSTRQTSDRHEETTRLFNEGRCFLCKERGHTKRDCSEKERFDRERRERVAAIVDRHLAHDNRQEAPATNEHGN
ncbi:unnamed protein product [Sordaria macrospora k-hell]|uniref:WGS project CABT00000000 data, contig 2.22 n=1 Tax=Sordaria macrospora (strain ATCC MYA-333 / DSM 997 / K(L3346) / K-hell) TaxID=771870 RepID=F7W2U7_SORMK|nr:uncharacterized protein SMAC_05162 [Sordaria macrospora k-hell]CCC11948.1 unnamed protein product [Sordaria macrospora k-hell]